MQAFLNFIFIHQIWIHQNFSNLGIWSAISSKLSRAFTATALSNNLDGTVTGARFPLSNRWKSFPLWLWWISRLLRFIASSRCRLWSRKKKSDIFVAKILVHSSFLIALMHSTTCQKEFSSREKTNVWKWVRKIWSKFITVYIVC